MPTFTATAALACPVEELFEFFLHPAHLLLVSPPDWSLEIEEAPDRLQLGSRVVLRGRRWGVPQRIAGAVTVLEPPHLLTDEQREGPFRRWIHTHRFEPLPGGTRITEAIEFEPPGGLLGLVVTVELVERELQDLFAYRTARLRERFGSLDDPD
jgi:ligand-binding SRPBCC domain-containing protein